MGDDGGAYAGIGEKDQKSTAIYMDLLKGCYSLDGKHWFDLYRH